MSNVNSVYFSKEDVGNGLMAEFIATLCRHTYESENLMNDIHIKPADLGAFVVEWEQAPWDHDYGGKFEYVAEDQIICYDVELPDGTFIYTPDKDEYLKEWLEENPGWEKDEWGRWRKKEGQDYIPKKSSNFTFHIFDSNSGKSIANDIPISEEKVNEIRDNHEKIKAEEDHKTTENDSYYKYLSTKGCVEPYEFSVEDD